MEDLIRIIRHRLSFDLSIEEIRSKILENGVSEEEFFLAFKAAQILDSFINEELILPRTYISFEDENCLEKKNDLSLYIVGKTMVTSIGSYLITRIDSEGVWGTLEEKLSEV